MFRRLSRSALLALPLALTAVSAALGGTAGFGGPGGFANNMAGQVSVSLPTTINAKVDMRHWENGSQPYKLANVNGNMKVTAHFSLTCPAGRYVVSIAYEPSPGVVKEVYAYDGQNQENAVAFSTQIEPLLLDSYELAGSHILESAWSPWNAEYSVAQASKVVVDYLGIISRCSSQSAKSQNFPLKYHFKVYDLDYVAEIGRAPKAKTTLKATPQRKAPLQLKRRN